MTSDTARARELSRELPFSDDPDMRTEAANLLGELAERIAELEGRIMGYEAEIVMAISECQEYVGSHKGEVEDLARNVIACIGPLRPTPPEGT